MLSKSWLEDLKKTKLISVEHYKKQKLNQISPLSNMIQPYVDDAQSNIDDINSMEDNTEDKTI